MSRSDKAFLKKTNNRIKKESDERRLNERRQKERRAGRTKKGCSKRVAEIKRLIDSDATWAESQGVKLLFEFIRTLPADDATEFRINAIWVFVQWLRDKSYSLIHENDLLIAPFKHLARMGDLK